MHASPLALDFAEALEKKIPNYDFVVMGGRKYDRIVQTLRGTNYPQKSVHAFVERRTGKLIKAATWEAPQRDKDGLAYRFNLSTRDGFQEAVEAATFTGSYLYV